MTKTQSKDAKTAEARLNRLTGQQDLIKQAKKVVNNIEIKYYSRTEAIYGVPVQEEHYYHSAIS